MPGRPMPEEIGADGMAEPVEGEEAPEFGHREGHDWHQAVGRRRWGERDGGIGHRPLPALPALPRFCQATQQPDEAGVQVGM